MGRRRYCGYWLTENWSVDLTQRALGFRLIYTATTIWYLLSFINLSVSIYLWLSKIDFHRTGWSRLFFHVSCFMFSLRSGCIVYCNFIFWDDQNSIECGLFDACYIFTFRPIFILFLLFLLFFSFLLFRFSIRCIFRSYFSFLSTHFYVLSKKYDDLISKSNNMMNNSEKINT